jgi:hypothetical protein
MKAVALCLVASILLAGTSTTYASQEAVAWKEVANAIPLGSKVRIHTLDGERMSGTLMRVGADAVLLKKNTRRPVPAVAVPFADIARLERDRGNGVNVGKAIAVGLAAGAGVVLSLFAIALQFD